jgi:LPXTG-motif cell wall-anchored protein
MTKPVQAPEPEAVQTAAAAPTVAAPTAAVEPEQTLPHTASGMPLLGLIGILSLAAFAALRIRSRHIS